MAVSFCIVASQAQDQQDIFAVASATARVNPFGRKVLRPGDAGFPSAQQISQAVGNMQNPGAIVLRANLSVFVVLKVNEAKNGAIVEDSFARAAAATQGV